MRPGFPFDLFDPASFAHASRIGRTIAELAPLSLSPPYPWGQWLYSQLITARCRRLKGDFVECGVAKGGMSILLGEFARRMGRRVLAFDTFRGLPQPDTLHDNPYFAEGDYGSHPYRGDLLDRLRCELARRDLVDIVHPIAGLFRDTLPALPARLRIAFLHVDVDLYRSAREVLDTLYPRVVEGGVVAVDDFFHHAQGPARAVRDHFHAIGVEPLLHVTFPYGVVIIKGERAGSRHRALDGNRYSFAFLRRDRRLRETVERSLRRARGEARAEARLLRDIITRSTARSADLYDYLRALAAYWDDMDLVAPRGKRSAYRI
ncbi:MAG: TylF/MycF/NovP-related O-methyltransferase [Myxococcota bacterium]